MSNTEQPNSWDVKEISSISWRYNNVIKEKMAKQKAVYDVQNNYMKHQSALKSKILRERKKPPPNKINR